MNAANNNELIDNFFSFIKLMSFIFTIM